MTLTKELKQQKEPKQGMLHNVMKQFDAASDLVNLNPNIKKILGITNNELIIHFPVRMDNGKVEIFKGYRVQHNNALGPYKGGLRYHPTIDIDAVKALAMWMTWKTSLTGLPYGGAKGGIQMDPKKYSQSELERITRRFTYALGDNIGPEHDIPAPDVNTNSQTMAWIADTYMSTKAPAERSKNQHVGTGKPVGSGGLEGRDRATGYGVYLSIKFWAKKNNVNLKGKNFEISVTDSGPGIPKKLQPHLFNLFFTTKSKSKENSGIGLSLSHQIIKDHNGALTYNAKSENTQFLITIPAEES